jgi:hypothetical protein
VTHTAALTALDTAKGTSPIPRPYTAQHAAPTPIVTKAGGDTPAARRLARRAWGTVLATASRSSSRPRPSIPMAAGATAIDPAHSPTHGEGRRPARTATTTAIVPHIVAPIADDHATSTRPTSTA